MDSGFDQARADIIRAGRLLDARGWTPATGGNLSARLGDGSVAITVSGVHKGHLTPDDIMRVDMRGNPLDEKKPSAETLLHTGLYALHAHVQAVLHSHPRASVTYSMVRPDAQHVDLAGYELLKIFPGVKTHDVSVRLPIFPNSQDMRALQKEVDAWFAAHPTAPPVYIVRGHGLTAGAPDLDVARFVTEATEEMMAYELAKLGLATSGIIS